ncbi:FecR family protein [Dyadobacter crusticola]|uniref:FecR family protein n=1 Tax=Dyadobacter crusticola TaxID=292407 RepID=UPI000689AD32|nr:FecR domain-containing protein [Dyadobacter crusticola]
MNRFETLLNRYLGQSASKEETAELFRMINTGEHDHLLGENMLKDLREQMLVPGSQQEDELMERLYEQHIKSRIEVSSHTKSRTLKLSSWLAAAAAITGIVMASWWFFRDHADRQQAGMQREAKPFPIARTDVASFHDRQLIHLPDGSTVLLNNGGELTYSQENFGKAGREVTLSGEGFFDVKHDPAHPFVVHTGKVTTTVLGTAFNVTASRSEQQVKVTVTRGRVRVGDQDRTYDVITPDQQIVVNTTTNDFIKENVNARLVAGWKDDFIILDNVTMREAVAIISQKFNVKLTLANAKLGNCHVSASFLNGERLEHILKVIAAVNQLSYTIQADGSVQLDGETVCQ